MTRFVLGGVLVLGAALTACRPGLDSQREYCAEMTAPRGLDFSNHPDAAAFQADLDATVRRALPGATLAIRNARGLWVGASGQCDIGKNVPMRPFTRSRIGSVTKTFVATTILKLVEEGHLSLDDTLASHLEPAIAKQVVNSGRITIRQLLNHRSGLAYEPGSSSLIESVDINQDDPYRDISPDEYLAMLYGKPALFEPGASWGYSNFGYVLLGRVIEQVTGMSRWDVIRSRIVEPLGLSDTLLNERTPPGLARGYEDWRGDGTLTDFSDWDAVHVMETHASIVSTAHDVATFFDALFNGDLLTSSSRAEMLDCNPITDSQERYGLGILCTKEMPSGEPLALDWNNGWQLGYRAVAIHRPDSKAVAVLLTNGSSGKVGDEMWDFVGAHLVPLLER